MFSHLFLSEILLSFNFFYLKKQSRKQIWNLFVGLFCLIRFNIFLLEHYFLSAMSHTKEIGRIILMKMTDQNGYLTSQKSTNVWDVGRILSNPMSLLFFELNKKKNLF